MTSRAVARRVLERVEHDGGWATPTLDGELTRAGLPERDRRLCSELVYGVLRHRLRIDRALAAHADLRRTPTRIVIALRVAAYQLLLLDRIPPYAAVNDAVTAARSFGGAKLAGFVNAVLRNLGGTGEPAWPDEPRARLEVEFSLPGWIVAELAEATASFEELAARAAGLTGQAPLVARTNRLRTTRRELMDQLAAAGIAARLVDSAPPLGEHATKSGEPADNFGEPAESRVGQAAAAIDAATLPDAFVIKDLGDPSRCESFRRGLWTVQDAGAQLVSQTADPRRGQIILDACAGVGGKSTHLAELSEDGATIDAADRSAVKLALGKESAARLGHTSIRHHVCDIADPNAPLRSGYDLIVLDAPCTGLGVLRRHPDAKWRLTADDVGRLAAVQRQLLDATLPRLAPGGVLIYSVCTFTRAEGSEQVRAFAARSGLRLVEERQTWPPAADAFYIAKLQR